MKSQGQYDREFKINAVKSYKESGKISVNKALDLGHRLNNLKNMEMKVFRDQDL